MPLASRFCANPLITPNDIPPSHPDLRVECVLNPGAFRYKDRVGLLLRVAETACDASPETVTALVADPTTACGVRTITFSRSDPKLHATDPRVFTYDGVDYLTTRSHLRLAWSDDGIRFTVDTNPLITGTDPLETYGVEDCRVTCIGDTYWLTYTAVSPCGVGVGCVQTTDWRSFGRMELILPPHNKDCAIFELPISGRYYCLHRPSSVQLGGNYIWLAEGPDGHHWGCHRCIARTRPGMWDSERIGAGAAPILTDAGWLEIYHGSDHRGRYCLGALLLDRADPARILARSTTPIMEPQAGYETRGFYSECIFTNGHIVDGDIVTVYYGAADSVVCGATMSIQSILESLTDR